MTSARRPRYCRCGTRLAQDNSTAQCAACLSAIRGRPAAPTVPADFWDDVVVREALASRHMGRVIRAWRTHAHHGRRAFAQEQVAAWAGITQTQLSRIENGPPMVHLDRLIQWAGILLIPADRLWFSLPGSDHTPVRESSEADQGQQHPEIEDMNRRELLRLISLAGSVPVEWDRLDTGAAGARLDPATLEDYAALHSHLWQVFTLATVKKAVMPLVRQQLSVLIDGLRHPQPVELRVRMYRLTADLWQLAGEIHFDSNQYTDAAQCYTLAALASREAAAYDLWACALVRHAFVSVYASHHQAALPLLETAASLADRGDPALSTRYWVAAVQAEAHAGLGHVDATASALDRAEDVHRLPGTPHNGGWLRFDGTRLPEQRGTCYVGLGRADLAEPALIAALDQHLSTRRRGGVLIDLATIGTHRRDTEQVLTYAEAAFELAESTGSGVIARRLLQLDRHLSPINGSDRIAQLRQRIAALPASAT